MFKAYEAVRDKWAYLDCYVSPGPIQFVGPASDEINFMVKAPDIEDLVKKTDEVEQLENERKKGNRFNRKVEHLSELSQARVKEVAPIPDMFEKGEFSVSATKKYFAYSALAKDKLKIQFPNLQN